PGPYRRGQTNLPRRVTGGEADMSDDRALTREEEVAIAKEIESGEREVREAVFSLDLALQYVLTLADKVRQGEIAGRHIFGDDERAEATEREENKRADAFL